MAPFWGAVIRSALSMEGFSGLFKAGWTTIKVYPSYPDTNIAYKAYMHTNQGFSVLFTLRLVTMNVAPALCWTITM